MDWILFLIESFELLIQNLEFELDPVVEIRHSLNKADQEGISRCYREPALLRKSGEIF